MKKFFKKYTYYIYLLLLSLYFYGGTVFKEYLNNHLGYSYSFIIIFLLVAVILSINSFYKFNPLIFLLSFVILIIAEYTTHYVLTVNVKDSVNIDNCSHTFKGVVIDKFDKNFFFKKEIILRTMQGDKIKLNKVTAPILTFTRIGDTLEKPSHSDIVLLKSAEGFLNFKVSKCYP